MNEILTKLHWRYATKCFEPSKKLTEDEVHTILESGRLAPSSYGLQPWKFIVVENPEVRKKLQEAAYGQPQIVDASHLVVLCRLSCLGSDHVEKFVESTAKVQMVPVSELDGFKEMLLTSVNGLSQEALEHWMAKQVYIALGFMLHTAALMEIDTCPMEGFENKKFDEILGLEAMGVNSVVLCTIGRRKDDDRASKRAKSRFEKEDIVHIVK
jgi:nitroreductase